MPAPRCITCGLPVGEEPLRLNRLENGQVCPSCRDRVLEDLPPALPSWRPNEVDEDLPLFPESDEDAGSTP